jgi:hypothetical protein
MDSLKAKLRPSRFPGMSPFMAAVVGFVLREHFTTPEIAEIAVSENENLVYIANRVLWASTESRALKTSATSGTD